MKKNGSDLLLWVEGATAGTLVQIKGQSNMTWTRGSGKIDTSDKLGNIKTYLGGEIDIAISVDCMPDLPDATGFALVESSFLANTTRKFQIRKGNVGGASPADVLFECVCAILAVPDSAPKSGPVSGKITIAPAAQPTVNSMSW